MANDKSRKPESRKPVGRQTPAKAAKTQSTTASTKIVRRIEVMNSAPPPKTKPKR